MLVVGANQPKGLLIEFNAATPAAKRAKGNHDIRMPGEEVPEVEHWKPSVVAANVNLGRLQTKDAYEAVANLGKPKPTKAAPVAPVALAQESPAVVMGDMQDMTRAELADLCKSKGLPVGGNKTELIARLQSA